MKEHIHSPHHWMPVALITAAALLSISDCYGQSGAAAMFEGRPAMAGAQGGIGAGAGMAQGGIGVQGADGAQRALNLRKPSGLGAPLPGNMPMGAPAALPAIDMTKSNTDMNIARDNSIAKDERGVVKKTKRGIKNTITRARHGVSPIDSKTTAEIKP